jgi:hypothetical protein
VRCHILIVAICVGLVGSALALVVVAGQLSDAAVAEIADGRAPDVMADAEWWRSQLANLPAPAGGSTATRRAGLYRGVLLLPRRDRPPFAGQPLYDAWGRHVMDPYDTYTVRMGRQVNASGIAIRGFQGATYFLAARGRASACLSHPSTCGRASQTAAGAMALEFFQVPTRDTTAIVEYAPGSVSWMITTYDVRWDTTFQVELYGQEMVSAPAPAVDPEADAHYAESLGQMMDSMILVRLAPPS